MSERTRKLLVVSDSKFFIEAIKFIVLSSDNYSVDSLSYKELERVNYEPGDGYSIIFIDLDCCSHRESELLKLRLEKLLSEGGKVYGFTFNVDSVDIAVDELIKTMHGDGLIRRPISLDKVLEVLDKL